MKLKITRNFGTQKQEINEIKNIKKIEIFPNSDEIPVEIILWITFKDNYGRIEQYDPYRDRIKIS